MQGTPENMQNNPVYKDVVAEVNDFFGERLTRLRGLRGHSRSRWRWMWGLVLASGWRTICSCWRTCGAFTKWDRPLLLGASRKSFMGKMSGAAAGTAARVAGLRVLGGASRARAIIRTHDVAATRQAVG